MTAKDDQGGGGSFREVRERHLPLFDFTVHRHDRGWPHPLESLPEPAEKGPKERPKRGWKTAGILHYPHHDEDEEEGEPRNADSR